MHSFKNYKAWCWIGENGEAKRKIMLHFENERKREEIIAYHFRRFYEDTYKIKLPSKLIERDNPHDFTFSSNSKEELFLEIVKISDSSSGFKKQSNQVVLDKLLNDIKFSTIAILPHNTNKKTLIEAAKKINQRPTVKDLNGELEILFKELRTTKKPVLRMLNDTKKHRFTITDGINTPLETIIDNIIKDKEKKGYSNIKNMVLIIDEQLIEYGKEDFNKACIALIKSRKNYAFKEIFLYSGQYSNDDGNKASFIFYPIKTPRDEMIKKIINS